MTYLRIAWRLLVNYWYIPLLFVLAIGLYLVFPKGKDLFKQALGLSRDSYKKEKDLIIAVDKAKKHNKKVLRDRAKEQTVFLDKSYVRNKKVLEEAKAEAKAAKIREFQKDSKEATKALAKKFGFKYEE